MTDRANQSALSPSTVEEFRALMEMVNAQYHTISSQYGTIIANQTAIERELSGMKFLLMGGPDPSLGISERMKALEVFVTAQKDRNLTQDTTWRNIRWLWTATGFTGAGILGAFIYIVKHFLNDTH